VKRDGVKVELRVPVEAEVNGQLEDEAAHGQGGNGEAIKLRSRVQITASVCTESMAK
jgi:hypothetical protein